MKVYIASPGFNEDQLRVIKDVETVLDELKIPNYSPFRDGIRLSPDATQEEKSKVFRENVENINSCDCMIAIIDDRDTGTTFEQGVFYSNWSNHQKSLERIVRSSYSLTIIEKMISKQTHPRLISYLSKPKSNISVMLTEASMKLCIGIDELREYLSYIDQGYLYQSVLRDDESFKRVLTH